MCNVLIFCKNVVCLVWINETKLTKLIVLPDLTSITTPELPGFLTLRKSVNTSRNIFRTDTGEQQGTSTLARHRSWPTDHPGNTLQQLRREKESWIFQILTFCLSVYFLSVYPSVWLGTSLNIPHCLCHFFLLFDNQVDFLFNFASKRLLSFVNSFPKNNLN